MKLYPQQQRLFDFIRSRPAMPSTEEMRQHMGWMASGSVENCLHRLRARGAVRAVLDPDTRQRKWELAA